MARHVTYSRNSTRKGVAVSTNSSLYKSRDNYHEEKVIHECRLQVTSVERQAMLHVEFIHQTCTRGNKIVLLGKFDRVSRDGSTLSDGTVTSNTYINLYCLFSVHSLDAFPCPDKSGY